MTMTLQPESEDPFFLDRPQTDRSSGRQSTRAVTRPGIHKDDTHLHIPSSGPRKPSIRYGSLNMTKLNTLEKKKQNIMIENEVRRMTGSFSHKKESEDDYSDRIKGVLDITSSSRKPTKLTEDDLEVLHKRKLYKRLCTRMNLTPNLKFLRQLGFTTHLHLTGCNLQPEGIKAICVLIMYENLRLLDVSGNNLGIKGLEYVLDVVRQSNTINTLDISNNQIGYGNVKYITSFLLRQKSIREIDISGNGFNDNDAKGMAKLIENDDFLLSLRASNNQFGDYSGRLIGEALKENHTMLELDLSWNHIRGKGAEEVAHGLIDNVRLISLNVAWNGFGHQGTCAMAHALMSNTTLEFLDLSHNRVHQKQFFELLEGLIKNKTLQVLRIGHNPIPAVFTSTFLYKLREAKDSGLRELDMSGVIVDKEFEAVLEEIQQDRIFVAKFDHSLPINVENWSDRFKTLHVKDVDKTYTVDPIRLFFYLKSNLRVIDMFREIDMDGDGMLAKEEVKNKLVKDGFPVSSRALDILFNFLDQDGDGMINMLDFMEAERKYKRKVISDRKTVAEPRKSISAASDPLAGSKYSSTFHQYMTKVHTNEKDRIADKISKIMNPVREKLSKKISNLPPIHSLADLSLESRSLDDDDSDKKSELSDILSNDQSDISTDQLTYHAPSPILEPSFTSELPEIKVTQPKENGRKSKQRKRTTSITPQTSRRISPIPKGRGQSMRRPSVSNVSKLPKIT
ncbi:leucine-rich repeat-containing protein 74A-like [Lineus longissimus]|uniref:leucine-rich repeat-containing protein 74A-like n=1 Tax=Lineus longissimus TaxID=88925 RepID=UPI00315E0026